LSQPDYVLDERFMKLAHENAASSGVAWQ